MPKKRQVSVRDPVQERSQLRVAQILDAAQKIIEHKGSATMKMGEIAETAGVSIGSIYQYFPNKRAIVTALAEAILQENTRRNEQILAEPPRSLVQLASITTALLDQYYELQRQNPAARDIWAGYHADKELRDIDDNDSARNRDYIFEMSKHLFRKESHEQAKLVLLIIINMGGAAVATAVNLDEAEGSKAMAEAKSMLYAAWETSVLPLGHKN